jgi:hypothetical protein
MPPFVRAQAVDLGAVAPTANDTFFVDTNVWYWLVYDRASMSSYAPRPYQLQAYPAYIKKALTAGARLLRSGLILAELCHLIEKAERDIHQSHLGRQISPKQFRHDYHDERARVVAEISSAWEQVVSMSAPLDLTISENEENSILSRLTSGQALDGFDLLFLEAMKAGGIDQVITDDGDYAAAPGVRMYTANRSIIRSTRNIGGPRNSPD